MGERLHVAAEIVEGLPAEQLNQIVDAREHTELVCTVCRGVIASESSETLEVIVWVAGVAVEVEFAHTGCKASGIYEVPVADSDSGAGAGEGSGLSWVPVLRPGGDPSALLVWESSAVVRVSDAEGDQRDPLLDHLFAHGFVAADGALDVLSAPLSGHWGLRWEGSGLRLAGPDGPSETFDDVELVAPPGWVEALREEQRCLVVYGSQLGLERPSMERVNEALQAGNVAIATVPCT